MRNETDPRWLKKNVKVWEPSKVHTDAKIGDGVQVGAFCEVGPAVIGDRVRISAQCFVPGGVTIGNDSFLGPGCRFTHNFPPEPKDQWKKIKVGQGVKIGASVTILCGVTIGDHAVIGAGSIVTKDVPPGETWTGNPAQKLEKRKSKGGK